MPAPLIMGAAAVAARLAAKKAATNVVKKAATRKLVQEAAKRKPLTTPKSAVKVKPAAKQKPNKPNESKMFYKVNDSGGRAYNRSNKEYDAMPEAGRFGSAAERQAMAVEAMRKAPVGRRTSIVGKKLNQAEARKATTPKRTPANPARETVKINSSLRKTAAKPGSKRK
jgi:hypothetical protein